MSEPIVISGKQYDQHVLAYGDGSLMLAPNVFKIINTVTITTAQTLWTPTAGKKFRLMGYHLGLAVAAGNVLLKDGAGGTIIGVVPLGLALGGPAISLGNGILSAVANNVLEVIGPATAVLGGIVWGREE